MRFELHFSEYKAIILNFEFSNFIYFFVGLTVGVSVFLAYKYLISEK